MDLLSVREQACPDPVFRLLFGKNERVAGQDLDPACLNWGGKRSALRVPPAFLQISWNRRRWQTMRETGFFWGFSALPYGPVHCPVHQDLL